MKKNNYILLMPLLLLVLVRVEASPTITFFFKPFADIEKISKKLRAPGALAHHKVHGIMQHVMESGILVTYAGYVASSSYNGEVIFPRKHLSRDITILVTPEMTPTALFENTILRWNLIPGVPAQMYACEHKYNDKTEQYYWNVQEIPLPKDNKILPTTIVIVANPKDIVMNLGITETNETANLVLPDVYVKKGINIIENSSYMLTIRHLFKPVELQEHREPFKILTHVID
jgi:hypothetical protein